jgi:adenosylcobinamide kinase/adenosylcobinamide-phosphate guanylyltransferase
MGALTLVVGGVRSGKSRFAEQLAAAHPAVVYLATADVRASAADAEMTERIERHRQRRVALGPRWRTVEEPWEVTAALTAADQMSGSGVCILVECVPLWVTNLLLGLPGRPALDTAQIQDRVEGLAGAATVAGSRVIVVSNEVGWGIMPDNALARRFGDVLGEANQQLARAAAEVHACLAGIPVRIK